MCGGNGGSCHDRYVLSIGKKQFGIHVWMANYREVDFTTLTLYIILDGCSFPVGSPTSSAERRWLKRLCQPVPSAQILSAMMLCTSSSAYHDGNKNLRRFIYYRQSASKPCVVLLEFISDLLVCTLCRHHDRFGHLVAWSAGWHGCRKAPTFYLTWMLINHADGSMSFVGAIYGGSFWHSPCLLSPTSSPVSQRVLTSPVWI